MKTMHVLNAFTVVLYAAASSGLAPSGKWDTFNFAPKSKTAYPAAIHSSNGTVKNAQNLVQNQGTATLSGQGSWVALDFGVEVGGLISLNFDTISSKSSISLSFTESPTFIRPTASDDSTYSAENTTFDGVLHAPSPLKKGFWTQPSKALRGGFRYLTIVSTSKSSVSLSNVSCAISFMPHVGDLRAYSGYFYTQDTGFHDPDFLTKSAYTVQTNTIPVNTGRMVPFVPPGSWANNATIGVAGPLLVDGAKRDRTVWPGDMGISLPTQFVSTNDLIATRNSLSTMFATMNPKTGELPYAGPPFSLTGSDAYHMWTLIGTHTYYLYSGDTAWLQQVWSNYTKAVAFVEGKVDDTGLMNITGADDWARLGGGGYDAEGNSLLYKVLTTASDLVAHLNDTSLANAWSTNATALKSKFNDAFWVDSLGMYRENQTTTLTPQDANSFALLYNLTLSDDQKKKISNGLVRNWNDLGPVAPELPDTISPFISGFELQAHFEAGEDERALDLIRRTWGYMLYTNISVQSTLLEGFTANGSLGYRYYDGYNNDPSFTSHAHGWSTGPTSALTYYILGLTITSPQGATWQIAPHIAGLPLAEGGFETPLGWFGVKWSVEGDTFKLSVDTPKGTTGVVKPPSGMRLVSFASDAEEGEVEPGDRGVNLRGGKHEFCYCRINWWSGWSWSMHVL